MLRIQSKNLKSVFKIIVSTFLQLHLQEIWRRKKTTRPNLVILSFVVNDKQELRNSLRVFKLKRTIEDKKNYSVLYFKLRKRNKVGRYIPSNINFNFKICGYKISLKWRIILFIIFAHEYYKSSTNEPRLCNAGNSCLSKKKDFSWKLMSCISLYSVCKQKLLSAYI